MQFKIEDNIPMPTAGGRGPRQEYPFLDMKVDQSIFVPGVNVKKMSGQVGHWKKNHGMNFAIRATTEDVLDEETGEAVATDGVRVWVKDPTEKSNRGRKAAATETATETDADAEAEGEGEEPVAETPAPKASGKKSKPKAEDSEY